MPQPDDEIDDFSDDAISALEIRHDMQRRRAFGARVDVDLRDTSTTLHAYVGATRARAMEALVALAGADAADALAITRLQAVVTQYLDVRDWTRGVIQDAQRAHDALNGETDVDD